MSSHNMWTRLPVFFDFARAVPFFSLCGRGGNKGRWSTWINGGSPPPSMYERGNADTIYGNLQAVMICLCFLSWEVFVSHPRPSNDVMHFLLGYPCSLIPSWFSSSPPLHTGTCHMRLRCCCPPKPQHCRQAFAVEYINLRAYLSMRSQWKSTSRLGFQHWKQLYRLL